MKSKDNNISERNACISQNNLIKYLKGELGGNDMNYVERHLSGCPMCSDVLEGLSLLESPDDIYKIENKLQARIDGFFKTPKPVWMSTSFRVAASILVFVFISGALYFTSTLEPKRNVLSENFDTESPPFAKKEVMDDSIIGKDEMPLSLDETIIIADERVDQELIVEMDEKDIHQEIRSKRSVSKSQTGATPVPKVSASSANIAQKKVSEKIDLDDEVDLFNMEFNEDVAVAMLQFADIEEEVSEDEIFVIVEEMPRFEDGDINKFRDYIIRNLKYPEVAAESGIQGRVLVSFVVEPTGKVSNVRVLRGVDPSLDKEAVRVIVDSPLWKPGMQRGKPVRVSFNVPVIFTLQ
jgi:TonB family protein